MRVPSKIEVRLTDNFGQRRRYTFITDTLLGAMLSALNRLHAVGCKTNSRDIVATDLATGRSFSW